MFTPITLPIRQPLLPLDVVSIVTGETIDTLLLRAEEGALRYCFNIALPGGNKRVLRVLAASVQEYLQHGRKLRTEPPGEALIVISDIFPAISPAVIPEISRRNLMRVLSCSENHLFRLAEIKCIQVTRAGKCGPDGQTFYCRKSVIHWLLGRRLT